MSSTYEPPSESTMIRRFLRAVVFFGCGIALGAGLVHYRAAAAPSPVVSESQQPDTCAVDLAAAEAEAAGAKRTAQICQSALDAIEAERRRYATILLEPNQGQDFVLGAVAFLLGMPAGATQLVSGMMPPQPKWILEGRQTPITSNPAVQYSWVNLETQQTEGPFKPEAPTTTEGPFTAKAVRDGK